MPAPPPAHDETPDGLIQAVDRALRLLTVIAEAPQPPNGPELARRAGVNRSTAWRLLATLEHHDLVNRDAASGRYTVGFGAARVAAAVDHGALVRRARPVLRWLLARTGEVSTLTVARGRSLVTIDEVVGEQIVSVRWVGSHNPLTISSVGKLLLASLSDEEIEALLAEPIERRTANTITDPAELRARIDEARRTGLGTSIGEWEIGLNGFSAAARDAAGRPLAFLSVVGPEFRLPESRLGEVGPLLLDAAARLSAELAAP
jgi:DNA-binding IclR family transcriptional regulator